MLNHTLLASGCSVILQTITQDGGEIIHLDGPRNEAYESVIFKASAHVCSRIIQTDEEFMIARLFRWMAELWN